MECLCWVPASQPVSAPQGCGWVEPWLKLRAAQPRCPQNHSRRLLTDAREPRRSSSRPLRWPRGRPSSSGKGIQLCHISQKHGTECTQVHLLVVSRWRYICSVALPDAVALCLEQLRQTRTWFRETPRSAPSPSPEQQMRPRTNLDVTPQNHVTLEFLFLSSARNYTYPRITCDWFLLKDKKFFIRVIVCKEKQELY